MPGCAFIWNCELAGWGGGIGWPPGMRPGVGWRLVVAGIAMGGRPVLGPSPHLRVLELGVLGLWSYSLPVELRNYESLDLGTRGYHQGFPGTSAAGQAEERGVLTSEMSPL